jgi:hypothetical protein
MKALALVGLLVAALTLALWVLVYRDGRGQPGFGHFLVPFTGGALLFFVGGVALFVVGVTASKKK